jgi:hypothetical protein
MIAEATPSFLETPELKEILLPLLDECKDYGFLADVHITSAISCLKALVQNIDGLKIQVKSGVFLFAWHIKAFKEMQAIQKV